MLQPTDSASVIPSVVSTIRGAVEVTPPEELDAALTEIVRSLLVAQETDLKERIVGAMEVLRGNCRVNIIDPAAQAG